MDKIMNNAVFIISAGTNDFAANYIPLPIRKKMFSIADYQNFVLQNLQEFLQGIHKLGARKMAVVGLPPVGCLPVIITLFGFGDRKCIEAFNSMSIIYNNKLKDILRKASTVLQGAQLIYVDVFTPLYDFILSPNKYGFEETMVGCCGTGMVEAGLACNANSLVCIDASKRKLTMRKGRNLSMNLKMILKKRLRAAGSIYSVCSFIINVQPLFFACHCGPALGHQQLLSCSSWPRFASEASDINSLYDCCISFDYNDANCRKETLRVLLRIANPKFGFNQRLAIVESKCK
ncbi:GDSL esterase/lipase At5g45960-like [Dioscorea cayenensis subsp. rotundata]|uniref:GDSL esterase/lipase At5g45960-like n=1 Tax=Dioscorea cayennensis subsp. rotundata TaxID=55577 RepID=A0AB40B486_DIOCR|nr:GDSL esterase/lipase At5g45960-like [Dioscorea cayenensis subsp. rotundata]